MKAWIKQKNKKEQVVAHCRQTSFTFVTGKKLQQEVQCK